MRIIDADYVLSKIGEYAMHPNEELVNNLAIAFDIVVDAPTIDAVEVVHGEWKAKSFHEVYCDNCGFTFDIMKCDFLENMKFCPNCGARMSRGERKDQ